MNGDVDLSQLAIEREAEPPQLARRRPHVMTRYVLPATLLLGFIFLMTWAARDYLSPPVDVQVVPVMLSRTTVQQQGTPLFNAAGWVEPRPTEIRVAALAAGVVENLLVVEDQAVLRGETIAELVKDDARLALARAEAEYQLSTAQVALAQARLEAAHTRFNDPSHLEAPIAEAAAALAKTETELANLPFQKKRAEANLVYNRVNYESKKQAENVIAAREIDQAKSMLESSVALVAELQGRETTLVKEKLALGTRLAALEELLELKPNEKQAVDEADAQLKANQARTEQARVAVDEAKLRLERMTISAPADGRVLALVATPGTRVASGAARRSHNDDTTVVTMYRPESLQLRVDVRFEDLPQVQQGQPVQIKSPAVARPLTGHVLFISSRADIQKNTLEVKVGIDNPPEVFKPEMLVDVTFLAPAEQATGEVAASEAMRIYIPKWLVQDRKGSRVVWVADQSQRIARLATVVTAAANSDMIEVTSGLTVGSRLIVSDASELQEGTRIRVTGEGPVTSSTESAPQSAGLADQRSDQTAAHIPQE